MLGSQQLPRRINSAQSPHISQPCFRTSGQSAVTSTPFIRWHAPPFAHGLLSLNARTGKNFRDTTFGHTLLGKRHGSSGRWLDRQSRDKFAREAKVQGLKSRAAFKLLQINEKYRLFRPGQTVVDLGYAPGSWSQVSRLRIGVSLQHLRRFSDLNCDKERTCVLKQFLTSFYIRIVAGSSGYGEAFWSGHWCRHHPSSAAKRGVDHSRKFPITRCSGQHKVSLK